MNNIVLVLVCGFLAGTPLRTEARSVEEFKNSRVKRQISQSSASASASSSSGNGANYGFGPGVGGQSAGCAGGLNCGFQLRDFLAQLPIFNQGYMGGYGGYGGGAYNDYDPSGYRYSNYYPQYPQQNNYPYQYNQHMPMMDNFGVGVGAHASSIGNLARFGGDPGNYGHSSTFTSSNVNGVNTHSSSGANLDPSGRVTTFQTGTGGPDTIQTRIASPGRVNGVYSSSNINVRPDGKVTSSRDSGHF